LIQHKFSKPVLASICSLQFRLLEFRWSRTGFLFQPILG
jgi:hypothetical protein